MKSKFFLIVNWIPLKSPFLIWITLFTSCICFSQERPNILWLTFEDTSPQFIGCYGNADADTPVMDKMAREGVRFSKAFSKGTVCSPSRSAIITGVPTYKMGTGNHRSNYPIPDFIKGFPEYLKNAGYYVTNNSKTDYNVANMKEFISDTWNESSNKAGWWNRDSGQPFFSVFNFADSHQSRTMTMSYEWYEKHVLAYLKPDDNFNDNTNKEITKKVDVNVPLKRDFSGLNRKKIISDSSFTMPPIYRDSDSMRKQMARVYNSIKLTDMKMGEILQRLEDEGLLKNTVVFIFSDHGEGIPRGKTNGIGLGYRIPFIMWFPDKYKDLSPWGTGGVVSDEIIDFEDLAPTLLSMTGVNIPKYMKGRPFLGPDRKQPKKFTYLSADRADNGLDLVRTITDGRYIYSRNFMPFLPELKYIRYMEVGAITQQMREDYKNGKLNQVQSAMFKKRPDEVLYDLKSDPWETQNLIGNPKYKDLVMKMRDRLRSKVLSDRDVHFIPEYELGKMSDTITPYEFRLNEDLYPIERIFEIANLIGKSDNSTQKQLFKSLKSPNKFVRYWASLGLFAMKENLDSSALTSLKMKLKDSYPPVQINLAALLYSLNHDQVAESILKKYILSTDENLALSAINYTLYFQNRSAFLDEIKMVHDSKIGYKVKAGADIFLSLEGLLPNKI